MTEGVRGHIEMALQEFFDEIHNKGPASVIGSYMLEIDMFREWEAYREFQIPPEDDVTPLTTPLQLFVESLSYNRERWLVEALPSSSHNPDVPGVITFRSRNRRVTLSGRVYRSGSGTMWSSCAYTRGQTPLIMFGPFSLQTEAFQRVNEFLDSQWDRVVGQL